MPDPSFPFADDSVVGPGRSLNMNMNRRRIVQFCKKRSARRPDGKSDRGDPRRAVSLEDGDMN